MEHYKRLADLYGRVFALQAQLIHGYQEQNERLGYFGPAADWNARRFSGEVKSCTTIKELKTLAKEYQIEI